MDQAAVDVVRRFNRTVTQRVGALQTGYLARDRSARRVARAVGDRRRTVATSATLRAALDLDSGYLSRLLRTLEAAGLVRDRAERGDRRVRTARLTPRGPAERALLDERSDALACVAARAARPTGSAPGSRGDGDGRAAAHRRPGRDRRRGPGERRRPVLPRAPTSPSSTRRFDAGFDPAASIPADADELRPPAGLLLLARLRGRAGRLRRAEAPRRRAGRDQADVGRADGRGLGLGRRLLAALERAGRDARRAHRAARDEPAPHRGDRAVPLGRATSRSPAFNDEPYAHHWFEKPLGG